MTKTPFPLPLNLIVFQKAFLFMTLFPALSLLLLSSANGFGCPYVESGIYNPEMNLKNFSLVVNERSSRGREREAEKNESDVMDVL